MPIFSIGPVHPRPALCPTGLIRVLLATLLVLAITSSARAADLLEFEQAIDLAQARSRQLPAQDAGTAAARDMAVAAGQLPDPTLKMGLNNWPVNGPDRFSVGQDFMTMRSIGVSQEFTRDAKLKARSARYESQAQASEASRRLLLANLQRDTAIAWLNLHYQEQLRSVLRTQRDEARLQIAAADAAYRGGKGSQADTFMARSSVALLDDRLAQADRQVVTATTQLARWIGDAARQPLGPLPAMDAIPFNPDKLHEVLDHHPELAVLAKQEDLARADADIARANRQTDWSADLMYSQRGSAYSNMVSINVSIPLQWDQRNRQDRELSAKLAMAEQARQEFEEAKRSHAAEVQAMAQEWQSDLSRQKHYDATLIPLAASRTRAALATYRGGNGSLGSVLDARLGEIDTRLERVRLEMDAARLWAQLTYLLPSGDGLSGHHPTEGDSQ